MITGIKHLLCCVLLFPGICLSQLQDHEKHFIAGMAIAGLTIPIAKHLGAKLPEGWALLIVAPIALGKEIIDHRGHHMRFRDESNEVYYDHISDVFFTLSGSMSIVIAIGPILTHRRNKKAPLQPFLE